MSKPAPSRRSDAEHSKNPLLQSLLQLVGQRNVITIHRPLVDFLGGSLEAAMLLGQLLYWTPRSKMSGWIAKTDAEFQDELCLTRYSVRAGRKTLEERNLVKTEVRRFNNFPTQHYFVDFDELSRQWCEWVSRLSEIEQTVCANPDDGSSEIEQTLTEITTEITTTTTTGADEHFGLLVREMEGITGAVNTSIVKTLENWLAMWEEHVVALPVGHPDKAVDAYRAVLEAIREGINSTESRRPSNKYIQSVLERWMREGFKSRRQYGNAGTNSGKGGRGNGSSPNSRVSGEKHEPTEAEKEFAERVKQRKQKRKQKSVS